MKLFDEEDNAEQILNEIDMIDDEETSRLSENKSNISKQTETAGYRTDSFLSQLDNEKSLSRFLKTELKFQEFNRKKLDFVLRSDNPIIVYQGYPLKDFTKGSFIFELYKPEKKMKKIKTIDISLLL